RIRGQKQARKTLFLLRLPPPPSAGEERANQTGFDPAKPDPRPSPAGLVDPHQTADRTAPYDT
ncbi:hypothetical protein HPP92_027377, partial [Vanilla planifolia]